MDCGNARIAPLRPTIRSRPTLVGQTAPTADPSIITPRYFETIGVPVLHGRAFTTADRDTSNAPAIISQSVAARYWKGNEVLGEQISFDGGGHWATIVGVVAPGARVSVARGGTWPS